jgi:hypothetical protein
VDGDVPEQFAVIEQQQPDRSISATNVNGCTTFCCLILRNLL